MKTIFWAAALSSIAFNLAAQSTNSQLPAPIPYAVASRSANGNVWQETTYEQGPDGNPVAHVHQYQEIATGLNYIDPNTGEWTPSTEVIEQSPNGFIAQHGQHQVIFASDLATFGAIDMQMPDGQQLQSHLLGVCYYDTASGQSVFIAQVTNCVGQLISSNQLWYDQAFDTLKAGVRYSYTRQGFEQDVILEECPPMPEAYGLNSSSTVLQALTEFISPPTPTISTNYYPSTLGVEEMDQSLQFSTMKIGRGRAFLMGNDTEGTSVCKQWLLLNGRQFLVEEVPFATIAAQLQTLPAYQGAMLRRVPNSVLNVVSRKRLLPAPPPVARARNNRVKIASKSAPKSGFVLDYTTLNTSQTNYTFQADTTYFLSGNVNLYGTATTFEGATVLKYASGVSLTVNTPVTWLGAPYRPVVMAAKDDNTVGESISGSTGNPGTNYYATKALYFDGTSALTSLSVTNLRILNANAGVVLNGESGHVLNDIQIVKCADGVAATNTDFGLHNALFANVLTNFTGSTATGVVEHLTSSTASWLNSNIGTNLFLTNCLFVGVTNLGNCTTQSVANLSSGSGIFQTVGGGSYYLATNSPYRNAGTTNINPGTLADLKLKTTYPPVVYQDTNVNVVTTFNPVVQRDNDIPDLGYHYDPIDYAFSGVMVNTNITFAPGTAVAWYIASGDSSALHLANQQIASFSGTFENPDYFARANTVQEGGNGNWTLGWGYFGIIGTADQNLQDVTLSPELRMTFTGCSVLAQGESMFRDSSGYLIVRATHSRITGGNQGGYIISYYLTNCLIDGGQIGTVAGWTGNEMYLRNCTLHEELLYISRYHTPPMMVSIRDCSFDPANVYTNGDAFLSNTNYSDFDYNAYTNASNLFPVGCANDKKSISFAWQNGPLGNFYLPSGSALIDAGGVTADTVGLYHFTTQTAAYSAETNSVVDIGYHYLAVDDNGSPLDTDGDGTPDYLEDANGNGVVDSGETDWQSATDLGLKVIITRPKNNSIIP